MKNELYEARKNNGFTQAEAAYFLGVSLRSYKSYEIEKEEIINTLFKKVKKGIKPPVNDNEGELPETMCCVWNFEESSLR